MMSSVSLGESLLTNNENDDETYGLQFVIIWFSRYLYDRGMIDSTSFRQMLLWNIIVVKLAD